MKPLAVSVGAFWLLTAAAFKSALKSKLAQHNVNVGVNLVCLSPPSALMDPGGVGLLGEGLYVSMQRPTDKQLFAEDFVLIFS